MKRPDPLRVDVFRFGDLEETETCCERVGLNLHQIRSLKAHPYAQASDPAGLLLLRNDRRIGRFGLIPGRMRVGGIDYPMFWGSGWEGERGAMAGLLLMRAASLVPTLGACGISEAVQPIYRAARFQIATLRRRSLLLRSGEFLRRRLGRFVGQSLSGPGDTVLSIVSSVCRLWSRCGSRGFFLEAVERFDERFDEVDAAARDGYWFPRDHREINWAMAFPWRLQPVAHRIHGFYLRRYGAEGVLGYAVVRVCSLAPSGQEGGLVASLMRSAVRRDAPKGEPALLDLLVAWAAGNRISTFEICSSRSRLDHLAGRIGMISRRQVPEIAFHFGSSVASVLAEKGKTLHDFEADLGEGDVIFA